MFSSQVLATLCATLGCLLNGSVIGYTGPAIPRYLILIKVVELMFTLTSLTNTTGEERVIIIIFTIDFYHFHQFDEASPAST